MRYISLLLGYFLILCLSLTGGMLSLTAQASGASSPEKSLSAMEKSSPSDRALWTGLESAVLVARVDDNFITQRDVHRRAIILNTTNHPLALQTLIEDRVLTAEAIRKGITVSDDEIDVVVKERLSSFKSLEEFEKQILQPLKMTREEYRQDIKGQLLRDKYIRSKIGLHRLTAQGKADFIMATHGDTHLPTKPAKYLTLKAVFL
ncbi:MAG: SurA N-terminal domain-containing protein [Planctomycetota bacterium]|nr:SurA N-terminal domain-containing protein [Planctomycetota bacterium]MDI6788010.1 SurA N-terminal domain-containing protein [Planctomycetota bacterium]